MENLDYFTFNDIPLTYNKSSSFVTYSDDFEIVIEKVFGSKWYTDEKMLGNLSRAEKLLDEFYKDPNVQQFMVRYNDWLNSSHKWNCVMLVKTCYALTVHDLISSKWGIELDIRKYLLEDIFKHIVECIIRERTDSIYNTCSRFIFYIKDPTRFSSFLQESHGKELAEFELEL